MSAPVSTQVEHPTGIVPPYCFLISACTACSIFWPKCFLITASRPPSMLPFEFVGVTQAVTACSSIEPWTTSTSWFSSNVDFQAATIFGFRSTRMTRTSMGTVPSRQAGSGGEFDERLEALLVLPIDDV